MECLPLERITKPGCANEWVIHRGIVGSGAFGTFQEACCDGRCNYIAKHIHFGTVDGVIVNRASFEREISTQIQCAKEKLCVPVKDAWLCKHGGTIVMPTMWITVEKLFFMYQSLKVRVLITERMLGMIDRLHSVAKVFHGDVQFHNVMARWDRDAEDRNYTTPLKRWNSCGYIFRFIDMGFARTLDSIDVKLTSNQILERAQENIPINSRDALTFDYEVLRRYLHSITEDPEKYLSRYKSNENPNHLIETVKFIISAVKEYSNARFHGVH